MATKKQTTPKTKKVVKRKKEKKDILEKVKRAEERSGPRKNILKKMLKYFGYTTLGVLALAFLFFGYVNLPTSIPENEPKMGVTFSARYAQDIGLDWKQTYLAMLDDLKVRNIRVPIYWDLVEKNDGDYDFSDVDWQLAEAQKREANIILVLGQKVPRWPECFVPSWIGNDGANRKEKLLAFEKIAVERYRDNHPEIKRWQVENEPFLNFGICPPMDSALLDQEIAQVRNLDPSRPIVVTDSGELSLWVKAAKRADVFGTTMYREVFSENMGHWHYPIGPNFFKAKELLIKLFANQKEPIVIELQGEPWVGGWTTSFPLEVQLESMNAQKLEDNIIFAKKTGMREIYLWGVEWWYWMKVQNSNPTLWEKAREFFPQ